MSTAEPVVRIEGLVTDDEDDVTDADRVESDRFDRRAGDPLGRIGTK